MTLVGYIKPLGGLYPTQLVAVVEHSGRIYQVDASGNLAEVPNDNLGLSILVMLDEDRRLTYDSGNTVFAITPNNIIIGDRKAIQEACKIFTGYPTP